METDLGDLIPYKDGAIFCSFPFNSNKNTYCTVIAVDALWLSVLRYDTPVGEIKSPRTDYLEFLSHAGLRNDKYTSPGKK